MVSDFHHVWSRGEVVIFRERDDYRYFLNHLSSALSSFKIQCLAYSVMSTHVHLILRTRDEEALKLCLSNLSKLYSIHFRKKYGESIPKGCFVFQYSDDKERFESQKNKLLYVLRNPVHHYSKLSPLSYEFSSAKYIFLKEILGEFEYKRHLSSLTEVKELSKRQVADLVGEKGVPENYLYDKISDMISPLSFVNVGDIKGYWGDNIKSFLYDMNSMSNDASSESIQEGTLEMMCNKYDDTEVCAIIAQYVWDWKVETFTKFSPAQKEALIKILKSKYIPPMQIKRCLW